VSSGLGFKGLEFRVRGLQFRKTQGLKKLRTSNWQKRKRVTALNPKAHCTHALDVCVLQQHSARQSALHTCASFHLHQMPFTNQNISLKYLWKYVQNMCSKYVLKICAQNMCARMFWTMHLSYLCVHLLWYASVISMCASCYDMMT